jgi:hypothetical protein
MKVFFFSTIFILFIIFSMSSQDATAVINSQITSDNGVLSLSSSKIQGAQILEIIIDDPTISILNAPIGVPSLTFNDSTKLWPAQTVDGKWYAYIVDEVMSETADSLPSGLNFGTDCTSGITLNGSIIPNLTTEVWMLGSDRCNDPDGPDEENSPHENLDHIVNNPSDEVLNNTPSVNRNSNANHGQIYAKFNTTSGFSNGAWPFIVQVNMASDNTIRYAGETLTFKWGSLNNDISVGFGDDILANGADINLIIEDNGLNIDPTTQDAWEFDMVSEFTTKRVFQNNTKSVDLSNKLGTIGFGWATNIELIGDIASFDTNSYTVTLRETGKNTGVFSSVNANGASNWDTTATATNYDTATVRYGGQSATISIMYNTATIEFDANNDSQNQPDVENKTPDMSDKELTVPRWIKHVAGYWYDENIPAKTFLSSIQWLVSNEIIIVTPTSTESDSSVTIPDWVKNTAGWWANDQIDDQTFVNAIQYLVDIGLIPVETHNYIKTGY